MVTELENIISQSEAARLRGVSREAIRDLIDRGRLQGVMVGGRLHVYRNEVLNFEPQVGGRPPKADKGKPAKPEKAKGKKATASKKVKSK